MGHPDAIASDAGERYGARPARLRDSFSWPDAAVSAVALIVAALVVLLIVRVGQSNHVRDRTLARERHSYEVMLGARAVAASMANAEAALGRFSISADRTMGSIYYNDWVLAGAQIGRLQTLVGRDPVETHLTTRLSTLYAERSKELGLPAASAARHQGWAALDLFNAAGHSDRIAAIDRTLDAIQAHEREKLERRYDQSDTAASDANHLTGLLSLTGLLLIVGAGALAWAVTVAIARHRAAEADADEAAHRADWLVEAVAERTRALSDANAHLQREIAERAVAEAQLRQMQKMDAVGQLTGGIAHDFNNMLAVVVGGLDLARRRLASGDRDIEPHLEQALEGADRAAALTRRLLGFARAEPLLPEPVSPARLIAGMTDLIDRTLGERVVVETRVAESDWAIWVDPLQLENAILNLAVNGRDAMAGAGRITIAADTVPLTNDEIGALPAGDYVRIAVSDTGAGMTPDILERVFEPFFTTKPVGKGTGLGLSQIFGFARQSDGDVAIASTPGKGTTVSLYLPRADRIVPSAAVEPISRVVPIAATAPAPALAETPVLVVEDDPRVRAATVGALAEIGYAPIACADGTEALAVLAARHDIAVVITDVVMPGMTGPELAARIRADRPAIEILFVTGYAGEDGAELQGEAVLRKPFTIAVLENAVAAAFLRADPTARLPAPGAAAAA